MSSAAATVISQFGTYNWNTRLYDVLALASRMAANLKNRRNTIRLAYYLHQVAKSSAEFVLMINDAMEGKAPADPSAEPVTPQVLRSSADSLEQLYRTMEYIVEGSRRAGLFNNSLTAASLRSIERSLDPVAAIADWLDLASQSTEVENIFQVTEQEREKGALIDLASIE